MISPLPQRLVPGIVGISTFVDDVYHREMQLAALAAANATGPINRLRSVTATLDFALLLANLKAGRRDDAEEQVAVACQSLTAAGCDFIVVTSGTTSTLTARARARLATPFLDLAESCWQAAQPMAPVGLLSTRYAAAGGIFQAAAERHGMRLILPSPPMAERVDDAIFGELVLGDRSGACVGVLAAALEELAAAGAQSVILGNTDMTLAAETLRARTALPLIDSAVVHARQAAQVAFGNAAGMSAPVNRAGAPGQ
jgi:aspartate racemase